MNKILIVDDNLSVLRMLEHTLSKEGYEVLIAKNGLEGLKMAAEEAPDLTILDVMLPGMDGFEVCHRLRGEAKTVNIPVLMLSAKGQTIDRETGLKVGADEYLTKPVERLQLLDNIQKLIAGRKKAAQKKAKYIAFFSIRGGAGASTVIVNTSVVIAKKGRSVILLDLCPFMCDTGTMLGVQAGHTIGELFQNSSGALDREDLEAAITRHSSGVQLLCGQQSAEEPHELTHNDIEILFQELNSMAEYVLIDLPAFSTGLMGDVLKKCDAVGLVTGSDAGSLARVGSVVAQVDKLGIERQRLVIAVVNRNGNGSGLVEQVSVKDVPIAAVIPSAYDEFAEAEARHNPVVLEFPDTPAAAAFSELADRLTGQ
jgi:DNA-binding response OmpR family regulator